jgi:hypothetical protein
MDAERWKRADELLQEALQMPAEQQDAFLRQHCGSAYVSKILTMLTHSASKDSRHTGLPARLYQ